MISEHYVWLVRSLAFVALWSITFTVFRRERRKNLVEQLVPRDSCRFTGKDNVPHENGPLIAALNEKHQNL